MVHRFAGVLVVSVMLAACVTRSSGDADAEAASAAATPRTAAADRPFFATAFVEDGTTVATRSEGDLWVSCWADDDELYMANGDGSAFGGAFVDIAMSRVSGRPDDGTLHGTTIARADELGTIWTPGGRYNRKPTGMLCMDGDMYLAVQDLELDFLDAPAATIAVSHDHGRTWSWDRSAPMFRDHEMTTLMFLDFGKNNANAIDEYVYVYALDQNWRFSTRVPSPTKLWLARVPKSGVQDRAQWTFFAGVDGDGRPRFVSDAAARAPVIDDPRIVYDELFTPAGPSPDGMTVLSQGSIVYDAPLKRYLYTSWTEFTFVMYEAPAPWGPWRPFLERDFGAYPWTPTLHGGYATSIPSKFISDDGRTMFVQSNTFAGGASAYGLSFREMAVEPFAAAASDSKAANASGTPVFRAAHAGSSALLTDGELRGSVDSWTGERKDEDHWGVVWPSPRRVNRIAYTTGTMFAAGGWFTSLRAQIRRDGRWEDVTATVAPAYPFTRDAGEHRTYVFSFAPVDADGVRVVGAPGGSATFTSASEVAASFER